MSINPLNDISKVYLEQVSESAVPGKPAERLGAVTAIPKSEQEAARERILAKTKAKRESMKNEEKDPFGRPGGKHGGVKKGGGYDKGYQAMQKKLKELDKVKTEELDPVGQEDADIDNDGDTDKSDKYLHNRRKAIGKAIKKKSVKEGFSNWRQDLSEVMSDELDTKPIKEKKIKNKIKINPTIGEAVEEIGGTLLEMVEIDRVDFSGVFDELSESEIFFLNDSLIEEVVEEFFFECLEEGYDLEEVQDSLIESLEISSAMLNEAKVTLGHDTKIKSDRLEKVKSAVKKVGGAVARGAGYAAGAAVRGAKAVGREFKKGYEKGRGSSSSSDSGSQSSSSSSSTSSSGSEKRPGLLSRIGSKLKSGLKKAIASGARSVSRGARNVARKMEGGETKKVEAPKASSKKAEKPSDPWEGSATTPPKAKAATKKAAAPKPKAKAPTKKKKSSNLDNLLASIRNESVIGDRAKNAVADDRLSSEQEKTSASMDKLRAQSKRHEKSTALARTQASIAAKKSEDTARAMHPKPGVRGHRVEEVQINEMPYQVMGSPDGKNEKKIGKPVKSRRYADARASELEDTHKKTGGKYRSQYVEEIQIDEKTLTKMEMKKREEIVKSMKDKASDFEKRYPGRGKEVMYATATKMAKKMVEQMMPEPTATVDSSVDKKKEMMDKQKLANMKMLQQKQQMLQKQRLQMQKSGKLPLETD